MSNVITTGHPAYQTALACVADWRAALDLLAEREARVDELYERYAGDEDEPADLTPEQEAEVEALADRLGIDRLSWAEAGARARLLSAYEDFVRACGATESQVAEFREAREGRTIATAIRVAAIVESA